MKFPRIPHLPHSPGATSDDKKLKNDHAFYGVRVVVTEKLDGENISLHHDRIHARSENMTHHDSRDWIKAQHAKIKHLIPDHIQLVIEYMYAKHSIRYMALDSYAYGIAAINKNTNEFESYHETEELFEHIGFPMAPVLYVGTYDPKFMCPQLSKVSSMTHSPNIEGYVVREIENFTVGCFGGIAKYVRANHVTTDKHWKTQWDRNFLKGYKWEAK